MSIGRCIVDMKAIQPLNISKKIMLYALGWLVLISVYLLVIARILEGDLWQHIGLGCVIALCLYLGKSFYKHVYVPVRKMETTMASLTASENTYLKSLEKTKVDILKTEAEINALQSQINPHFLYNVLDTIRGHALTEGVSEIAEMTEALSNLFRYSVSRRENMVTLDREIKNVQCYFSIQQYRFNNKFDLKLIIQGDEDKVLGTHLPKLTLQPIIENAIYHGLEMKLGQGQVTINARIKHEFLVIEIRDDGVGMDSATSKKINLKFKTWKEPDQSVAGAKHSGIALVNVNNRIKMMYGEDYGLQIYSTEGVGTMVEILLPSNNGDV